MKCLQTDTIHALSSFFHHYKIKNDSKKSVSHISRLQKCPQSDVFDIEVLCEVVVFMSSAAHAIYAAVHGLKVIIGWTLRALNRKLGCLPPKMDGENNGKPYEQMDDLGGSPFFWDDFFQAIF